MIYNFIKYMNFEDKKKRLLAMLDLLSENNSIFDDMKKLISDLDVGEWLVDHIFEIIDLNIEKAKQTMKEWQLQKLLDIQQKIKDIRLAEESDREDADSLLAWIM